MHKVLRLIFCLAKKKKKKKAKFLAEHGGKKKDRPPQASKVSVLQDEEQNIL